MLTLFFLSSGLFLGWSLGANDAANIFGTAVGSRMIKFRTAAIIASIFVLLGAVLQGSGTTKTLSQLGSVDAIGGAFTVALCSGIVVMIMTKYKLPVSTGQAIVGAIIGWCYFTSSQVDYTVLGKIISSWIFGPVLGAIFSALLYLLVRKLIRSSNLHLLKFETIIRLSLIIVGAFGAYSLGANNIANVMGVFVNSIDLNIALGNLSLNSTDILFFIGGLAISLGIFTYSKRVMETIGGDILAITPEGAVVVVLSQALVLFIFSSTTLSHFVQNIGLPAIPLVPVSSTQVVVGSVLGIGLVKGMQEVKLNVIGNIMLGWVLTPILSGAFTFFSLFFVKNLFNIKVTSNNLSEITNADTIRLVNVNIPVDLNATIISLLLIVLAIISIYLIINQLKSKTKSNEKEHFLAEQMQFSEFQKALSEIEVSTVQLENTNLVTRIEEQKNELVTYSLNLSEQRQYLLSIIDELEKASKASDITVKDEIIKKIKVELRQKISFNNEVDSIYHKAEIANKNFIQRLDKEYPELTQTDKKILVLLRIGLSSKEIAPLMNISPKSVEISRYRLRKKLNLDKNINLSDFSKSM
jgi:phosphate/sulfate permease/DNA-binding CsgD family transcriptional regulator